MMQRNLIQKSNILYEIILVYYKQNMICLAQSFIKTLSQLFSSTEQHPYCKWASKCQICCWQ